MVDQQVIQLDLEMHISIGGIAATTINSASGFTITNIDANNYSFPSGVTATFTQKGGGGLASAGPTSITN